MEVVAEIKNNYDSDGGFSCLFLRFVVLTQGKLCHPRLDALSTSSNIFCAHGPQSQGSGLSFAVAFRAFLMFSSFACRFAREKSTARATLGSRLICKARRPPFPFSSLHPHPHSASRPRQRPKSRFLHHFFITSSSKLIKTDL